MTATQALARPFTGVRAAAQSCKRSCRLVVRAQQQKVEAKGLPALLKNAEALKPAAVVLAANVLMALPAHAEEAGKIFDFNLTLPIMVGEFLALMVFLDKTWFGPVGAMLDKRDGAIREKLTMFKDNTGAVAKLQEEAEQIIAEARAEAQKNVMAAKADAQGQAAKKLADMKEKVDKELATALRALESEKAAAMTNLDSQVDKLSVDILAQILPEGVKI